MDAPQGQEEPASAPHAIPWAEVSTLRGWYGAAPGKPNQQTARARHPHRRRASRACRPLPIPWPWPPAHPPSCLAAWASAAHCALPCAGWGTPLLRRRLAPAPYPPVGFAPWTAPRPPPLVPPLQPTPPPTLPCRAGRHAIPPMTCMVPGAAGPYPSVSRTRPHTGSPCCSQRCSMGGRHRCSLPPCLPSQRQGVGGAPAAGLPSATPGAPQGCRPGGGSYKPAPSGDSQGSRPRRHKLGLVLPGASQGDRPGSGGLWDVRREDVGRLLSPPQTPALTPGRPHM